MQKNARGLGRDTYFRSARFNMSPLHYLRAWHRLCQPRRAETRTALNFAFINTESKIEVFHGKNWKNTLSAVIGDLKLYNAWYKKRKNVKQKNVKQPIVIRFHCSSVLSHLDGDQINIFVKAYAFPNKLNYKKENTNTALTRCQIQFSPWKGSQTVEISSLFHSKQKAMYVYVTRQIAAF